MQVRDEGCLKFVRRQRGDSLLESRLSASNDSRPEIDEVRRPLTTMAVAGPDLSGSGRGVPVPSNTTCVRDWLGANEATSTKTRPMRMRAMVPASCPAEGAEHKRYCLADNLDQRHSASSSHSRV